MSCDLKQKILQLDARVPRYTSYPTAPHFQAIECIQPYINALRTIDKNEALSLYVHIPFCPKLCWYCGCNTKISRRYGPVEDYIHLLLHEIDLVAEKLGKANKQAVSNIHFGGGSPSYVRPADFDLIMKKLRAAFYVLKDADIAIEVDPRNVTEGRIANYAKNGVNRVSLGVQDFNDAVLAAVNRQQPFHLSYDAMRIMREYGINNINLF